MNVHVKGLRHVGDGLDIQAFRAITRSMVNSVAVVTASHRERIAGAIAGAFQPVCAAPATVLIGLDRAHCAHGLVASSRRFVVNVLADDQIELGNRFGGIGDDRFGDVDYTLSLEGTPILDGVLAVLECETVDQLTVACQTIFVGRVLRGSRSRSFPLVSHNDSYMAAGR
ncbi:flavin reductase family protein [Mesorhizobium sp. L-8-10]|uniref:flavin reductase family protein n=1 Tax=Mesorhizobium sp. L-8-10 TaxID=2744523 RepID=UPI00192921ED|nr:flavin reductase family protein [Mesorhizobium sp. L-8-10]